MSVVTLGRLVSYAVLSLGCIALAQLLPRDLGWDQINHHFYLGAYASGSRLSLDFMPVGAQAYQVPYANVPFAAMVQAGVPPRVIVGVLAFLASINLWLLFEIGRSAARAAGRSPLAYGWASAVLGGLAPIFLQQLGTSWNDVLSAVPVVGAYALLLIFATALRAEPQRGASLRGALAAVAGAGVLLGMAAGLKLSNALSVVAAPLLLLAFPVGWRALLVLLTALGGGMLTGFLATTGAWMWQLWQEFGNPLFPMFNAWFCSPDAACGGGGSADIRFVPQTFWDAVRRPFEHALPFRMIYTEASAPDARFGAVLLLFAALLVLRLRAWRDRAPVMLFGLAFLISLFVWLDLSGNGRYFMPWLLLMGPLAIAIALALRPGSWRVPAYLAVLLVAAQAVQSSQTPLRWGDTGEWSDRWYDLEVPRELDGARAVVLFLGTPVPGMLPARMDAASRFVTIGGSPTLARDLPGGARVVRVLENRQGPVFGVGPATWDRGRGDPPDSTEAISLSAARFGWTADPASCTSVRLRGVDAFSGLIAEAPSELPAVREPAIVWGVCRLRQDPESEARVKAEDERLRPAFEALENRCPRLFPPGAAVTLQTRGFAARTYAGTDMRVVISNDQVSYRRMLTGGESVPVGSIHSIDSWAVDCRVEALAPFGGVVDRGYGNRPFVRPGP